MMVNHYNQYNATQLKLNKSQQRRTKKSKSKARIIFNIFVGLLSFGFFMGLDVEFASNINVQSNVKIVSISVEPLFGITKSSSLVQKHGKSIYDISGDLVYKNTGIIKINRKNKRSSTHLVRDTTIIENQDGVPPTASDQLDIEIATTAVDARKKANVKKLSQDKAFKIALAKIEKSRKNSQDEDMKTRSKTQRNNQKIIDMITQPLASELLSAKVKSPQILSSDQVVKLDEQIKQQIELNLSEQAAPMPNIYSALEKSLSLIHI